MMEQWMFVLPPAGAIEVMRSERSCIGVAEKSVRF